MKQTKQNDIWEENKRELKGEIEDLTDKLAELMDAGVLKGEMAEQD